MVKCVKEVFFINAVFLDALLNSYAVLELIYFLNKIVKLFFVILALYTESVGNLSISFKCVRMVILREGTHLRRNLGGIEAKNIIY